jgi:hypothetical protein
MDLPGADKVMVLLKTGATELYQKLPTHFMTTLRCTPHYLLYSDLSQSFADIPLHDAIAPVTNLTRSTHPDFTLYTSLQEHHASGLEDLSDLSGDSGWNLDKWKFLPMMHHAYTNSPSQIEWFLMIEADTSLSWLNLLSWLPHLNASESLYIGSQNMIGPVIFAHGGSGVLMSRPALAALESFREEEGTEIYDARWENSTAKSCCGDAILANALLESGTPMTGAWPIIQGETISTVPFTSSDWCAPPVTFHHVSSSEVNAYWQFQMQWAEKNDWDLDTPHLYRDVFSHFVEPIVREKQKEEWNNLSEDWKFVAPHLSPSSEGKGQGNENTTPFEELEEYERASTRSAEECKEACLRKRHSEDGREECKQWKFSPGRCYLGKEIKLGTSAEGDVEGWVSGWEMPEGGMGNCEDGVRWDVLVHY